VNKRLFKKGDRVRLKVQTFSGFKGYAVVTEDQITENEIIFAWREDFHPPESDQDTAGMINCLAHEIYLCKEFNSKLNRRLS